MKLVWSDFFAHFLLSNDKVMVLLNLAKNESYLKDSNELNIVQRLQRLQRSQCAQMAATVAYTGFLCPHTASFKTDFLMSKKKLVKCTKYKIMSNDKNMRHLYPSREYAGVYQLE